MLSGLQQLENFIEKYASTHLDTKSIVNSTRIINGKYFGKLWLKVEVAIPSINYSVIKIAVDMPQLLFNVCISRGRCRTPWQILRPTYITFFQSAIVIPFTAFLEVQLFIVGNNYRNGISFIISLDFRRICLFWSCCIDKQIKCINKGIFFTLIVIMVEKIGDGRKSDVTYPSEDNMKVKIIIPAEFFKTRGREK